MAISYLLKHANKWGITYQFTQSKIRQIVLYHFKQLTFSSKNVHYFVSQLASKSCVSNKVIRKWYLQISIFIDFAIMLCCNLHFAITTLQDVIKMSPLVVKS